ncbi:MULTISPECIES: hypothetical protein [unclassified Rothia (in: high G+C Gram-positive bacteria)]|uniref:hypothetical protein n=1 Tax=unclassified Rothia (in: high G+C Gram-positive bacteria) TaxID=2689056 RepID=UPI0019592727|nr:MULTISPECIES: hypothetical protein [unclassified Rothia (in: high G+C Gram-positive bacteria)]MBM7052160.1 hypothetical protein [Rothia sp. ZJ1223]QRZ61409.1 hypothetical protein JR346_09315 [Rothia sp. ZJ932]
MKSQYLIDPPVRFRARTGYVYTAFAVIVALILCATTVMEYGVAALLTGCWPWFFLAYGVWYLLGSPVLEIDREEIRVKNPFKYHRVGYPNLVDISTKFHFTAVTSQRRYQSFAVPSNGMAAAMNRKTVDTKNVPSISYGAEGGLRTSDLPHSLAGGAALVARGYWQEIVEAEHLESFPNIEETTFDVKGGVIFALLALAAALSVLL